MYMPELRGPLVAVHRGGYFGTQGVLRQFAATLDAGYGDILEMDLRASRDGTPYVFHDSRLEVKSNCSGDFATKTDAELARCSLRAGDPIPRFADVLALAKGRAIVNAEFKTPEVIVPAIRAAEAAGMINSTYFQAQADRAKVALARNASPQVWLQFKARSDDDISWITNQQDPRLRVVEMNAQFATPERIARLHAAGKLVSVNAWRYQLMEERVVASCDAAFGRGIDIAVTNNPGSCQQQRGTPLGQTGEGFLQRLSTAFNVPGRMGER